MFSFLFLLGRLSVKRLSAYSQFPIPTFNNSPLSTDHRRQAKQCMIGEQPLQAWSGNKRRRQLKEFQVALRIGLAKNVGGVEKSGNKYAFFFLFRKMFYQHFKCIKSCLSSLICYFFFFIKDFTIIFKNDLGSFLV